MVTWLALKAINFYQKFISPYKGFNCAHRVATGEVGCSGYGKKVISRFGLVTGIKLLNRRFYDCGWHAQRLQQAFEEKNPSEYKRYQRANGYSMKNGRLVNQGGFVDCDGCDVPDCDMPHCDMPDVADCVPDCGCNPVEAVTALDFCDCLPDDCGNSGKRHSPKFKEKRNARNEAKYNNEQVSKGMNLQKDDDNE